MFSSMIRKIVPKCLINNRILIGHLNISGKIDFLAMGKNLFPTETIDKAWETSATMNYT